MLLLSLKNDRYALFFEPEYLQKVWKLFCELRNILRKALLFITEYMNNAQLVGEFRFSEMNDKAFGNVFRNLQKSFHTFAWCSGPNKRYFRPFFQLNNSISIYKIAKKKKKKKKKYTQLDFNFCKVL